HPARLFDRIFAGIQTPGPDPQLARLRADRKSVLDLVADQHALLDKRLGTLDRQRLASHLDAVRELEKRVTSEVPTSTGCLVPTRPSDDAKQAGMDVIAHALACDLVRVATIAQRESAWTSFGVVGDYHDDYVHRVTEMGDRLEMVVRVKTYE